MSDHESDHALDHEVADEYEPASELQQNVEDEAEVFVGSGSGEREGEGEKDEDAFASIVHAYSSMYASSPSREHGNLNTANVQKPVHALSRAPASASTPSSLTERKEDTRKPVPTSAHKNVAHAPARNAVEPKRKPERKSERKSERKPERKPASTPTPPKRKHALARKSKPEPEPESESDASLSESESEPEPEPESESEPESERTAYDDFLDALVKTDLPLPLPRACSEFEQIVTAPTRIRGMQAIFADSALFDAADMREAEAALKRAETKATAATEADLPFAAMVGKTANMARLCNQRWEAIERMVRDGDVRSGDELLEHLMTRQFSMRRDVIDAIRALGSEYE